LIYKKTETRDTNQQWENLKHAIKTVAKESLGKLKQQPRKWWISERNHNHNGTTEEAQT